MDDNSFIERQINFMDEIIKMHGDIKNIHITLGRLYPITVINNGYFFVFDIQEAGNKYEFKLKTELPIHLKTFSGDILAAFPIEFYGDRSSAVISNNILENPENYPTIFHEFVHCFQGHNGEADIRKELSVEKQERAKQNYGWEINYLFPYDSEYFITKTIELSNSLAYENMVQYHKDMKAYLQETEFEYMVWQEWKEGYARYVENLIRKEFGSNMVSGVWSQPFDRSFFYEIGSKYIEMLTKIDKKLSNNIEELFYRMKLDI
jgi:hypothetical protein